MLILVPILGVLAVLIVIMAAMDLRARRHGRRLHVDSGTAYDERRRAEAGLRARSNYPPFGNFTGGGF